MRGGVEIPKGSLGDGELSQFRVQPGSTVGALAVEDCIVLKYGGSAGVKTTLALDIAATGTRGELPSAITISRQDERLMQIRCYGYGHPLEGETAFIEPLRNIAIEWNADRELWLVGPNEYVRHAELVVDFVDLVAEYGLKRQLAYRKKYELETSKISTRLR